MKSVKGKKRKAPDMSGLEKEQLEFIQAKVMKLGSIKEVDAVYNRDDAVSAFARVFARAWFSKKCTPS